MYVKIIPYLNFSNMLDGNPHYPACPILILAVHLANKFKFRLAK